MMFSGEYKCYQRTLELKITWRTPALMPSFHIGTVCENGMENPGAETEKGFELGLVKAKDL